MAKTKIVLLCILWFACSVSTAQSDELRSCALAFYRGELGVVEVGNNGGKRVGYYQHNTHTDSSAAWCASFYCTGLLNVCIDNCRSPLAADYFRDKKKIVYDRRYGYYDDVKPIDAAGIYFPSLHGIHHIMAVEEWNEEEGTCVVIAGNSNDKGSRNGDGVVRKQYDIEQIYQVSDPLK